VVPPPVANQPIAGGKQYLVVPIGGGNIPAGLAALSLP
jgi:hypothetical protein